MNHQLIKKPFLLFLFLLLAAAILSPPSVGHSRQIPPDFSKSLSDEERGFLENAGPIRVHNEQEWAPINFNERGTPKGFSIDYIKLLAAKTGLELEFITGPSWNEFLEMIKQGRLEVMLNIARNQERENFLEFTPPYFTMFRMLYIAKDSPQVRSMKDLHGKRFAVIKGFHVQHLLKAHPEITMVEVANSSAAIMAVSTGRADALFEFMPVVDHLTQELQITNLKVGGDAGLDQGKPIALCLAVGKGQKVLAGILEKGMERISREELRALKEKWLDVDLGVSAGTGAGVPLELTAEERDFLAGKQIRLGVDAERPPFEFFDDQVAYAGITAGFVHAVSQRLGLAMVPQKGLPWTKAMEQVRVGGVDAIPKATPTPERQEFLTFTRPYASFPTVIVTRKDRFVIGLEDLYGLKAGVVKGLVVEDNLRRDHPSMPLILVPNLETGLRQLSTGALDALVDNLGTVTYNIDKLGLANLKIAAPTPYTQDLAIGVRKDWPLLASALDKALASLGNEEKAAIKTRWLGIQVPTVDWRDLMAWGIPIAAGLLLVIVTIIIWNRRLGREVLERKSTEERLRAMAANVPGVIFQMELFADGRREYRYLSPRASEFFGAEPETVIREKRLLPWHSEDQARIQEEIAAASGGANGINLVGRILPPGGEVKWVQVTASASEQAQGRGLITGFILDITPRKLAEMEYLASERKIKAMSQAVVDALVMLDSLGKVRFWNQAAEKLFGYYAQEALGRDFHEMATPPAQREQARQGLECFARSGQAPVDGATQEMEAQDRQGRVFPVEVSLSPFQVDGEWLSVITFRDITERREAQQALAKERALFLDILEKSPISIAITTKGIIRFVNPIVHEKFGFKVGDPAPKVYVREADRDALIEILHREGIVKNREVQMWSVDHRKLDMLVTYLPMTFGDETGVLAWLMDITERKRVEEEMRQYVDDLERFNHLTLGREVRMIELKEEVNQLLARAGQAQKYKIVDQADIHH
jgi:PAS domain S-box-containing protein